MVMSPNNRTSHATPGLKQHTRQDDSENEDFPDKTTKLRNFCYKTDLGI
ncbi:hypothetical protein Hdeb2414_s0017g00508971 [Helianthus debilis subsp. tardiflorus]